MNQHDTLTQALEQIAIAAEATVCNPAWIAQHARAALATPAQAQKPNFVEAHDPFAELLNVQRLAHVQQSGNAELRYATRLAAVMWARDWKAEAPDWEPCDNLMGVLTQICNMVAGMERKAQAQQPPYAWAVSGASTMFFGPTAEYDARQEAKRCGGTAEAFPLFKEAQAAQQAMAQPIGHVVSYKPLEHTAVIEWYPAKNGVPPAGFNVGSKLYLPAAQQTSDDVAKDAARFTKDVPTEQGWYWHWNGDEECAPIPTSVLWSGTTKSCFVSRGQLGLDEAVYCDKYGGYWLKMTEPWGAIDAAMQADAKGGA